MTPPLEHLFRRAARLPLAVQDRLARRWLQDLEAHAVDEKLPPEDAEPLVSAYDAARHLAGVVEGPGDLSTNPAHMEGFGEDTNR